MLCYERKCWGCSNLNSAHYSYKSPEDLSVLFRAMLLDSELAAKFSCGGRKTIYVLRFGLAPHFKAAINSAYVLLFDESYNSI